MIQNRPSSVVDQLFQWVQESIGEEAKLDFNSRLLRYGQAFTKLLRDFESSEGEDPGSPQPGVRSQFLQGYEELYRTALSRNNSQIFRNRIVQSLVYSLRISFDEGLLGPISDISDTYMDILEMEFKQFGTTEVVLNHIEELETPFVAAVNQFLDDSTPTKREYYTFILCYSITYDLMDLSAEHDSGPGISKSFDVYDDTLSKGTLDSRIMRMWRIPENIPQRISTHQDRLEIHERVRNLDLIGRCLRYFESDSNARVDPISVIRERSDFDSDISGLFDSMFISVDSNIELEPPDTISSYIRFNFVRQGPNAGLWRARAYVLEFLRLGWPNQDYSYKLENVGIPSSPKFKDILKRILNAHNWPELEDLPTQQFLDIEGQELDARLFISYEAHRDAFDSAHTSSLQRLRDSELNHTLVNNYKNTRNQNANRDTLIKYLKERGNIQTKSYDPDLSGVPIAQYFEPKELFVEGYAEEVAPVTGPSRNRIIQNGYSNYLLNRIFRKITVDSQSKLENISKKLVRRNLSHDPIVIESGVSLFDEEATWEEAEPPHEDMGIIKKWNSTPVFSEPLDEFDAIVVYGTTSEVVEFKPDSGLYNIEIQPAREDEINIRLHEPISEDNLKKCVVTAKIRFGLRSNDPIGVAVRISD